ncbi:MAG TPA: hypothetical protein VEJ67_03930 [Candidatus Cybelea sp.]|nr:hypothetical protein [Candidatus Cybelea sp.]
MNGSRRCAVFSVLVFSLPFFSSLANGQQAMPDLSQAMRWRNIGPYRGGRTRAVAGVPGEPNVFYIGVCNGGVWKSENYGRTWEPVFDGESSGSIGSLFVAPSDPNIVYAGSGEGLHRPDLSIGDGIYKSTDAGRTWRHLGLRDGQQIPGLAVDPHDPGRLFAAVAGHPYGPNNERGIFRSTDGGQTFEKVLYKDEYTGGDDVVIDPANPQVVYATLWQSQEGPWENGAWNGTNGGIFKSTDGGSTWQKLTGGLPEGVTQAHLAISMSNPQILFASVATPREVELYRSEDGGQSWTAATSDRRPAGRIGGGDLPVPGIDPQNPQVIYVTSVVTWKSTDGGKTWVGLRGAPGGDDYQNIWINPNHPEIILLASDQGAIVTVDGGETWSSWYNQSTAQMYHVSADNAFPYRLCSGQQESGSACIASRGSDGQITIRDWHPVAAEEYGYAVPDPLDPDIVYGGKLTRYDRRTTQAQNIMPKPFRSKDFRVLRTAPIVFSPENPHILYFAANTLWKTADGGNSWQQISPDLARKTYKVPPSVGKYRSEPSAQPTERGVIYAVAPSPLDPNRIWAGTDDGQIDLTIDGGAHWTSVTPPDLMPFEKVSIIEAGHFDAQTAYAAVNTLRLDDLRPHILRTRNGGKTWTEIVNGIPENENVNVVREDPKRKGLLFAGTEEAVYVSFDDGDHWQSLRLNMPATSMRDLLIKNDDLAVATHGRGFWILDDITPLRQLTAQVTSSQAYLFSPEVAYRVRWDTNPDTPLPPDFPAGQNPPDGAVINYYLAATTSGPITLEIEDSAGKIVRRWSSADQPQPIPPDLGIPTYWVRPAQVLSGTAGMHRFLWDLHYARVPGMAPSYPIAAVPHSTAPQPTSPWAMPGEYRVVLTAEDKKYTQPLTVKMDPRVKTSLLGLKRQFTESMELYERLLNVSPAFDQAVELRKQLAEVKNHSQGELLDAVNHLDEKLQGLAGAERGFPGAAEAAPSLGGMRMRLLMLMNVFQEADVTPTSQASMAASELAREVPAVMESWASVKTHDIPALNAQLRAANVPEVKLESNPPGQGFDEDQE